MPRITARTLKSIKPQDKPYFIRDTQVKGFGLRVFPTGTIKYITEISYGGKCHRKTLGRYPILELSEARNKAITYIQAIHVGLVNNKIPEVNLGQLFTNYLTHVTLKDSTKLNHTQAVNFYLKDWLGKPVSKITRGMVERRFVQIRDKGISGGKPTYSQATKTMRILSALMNYAMADDLIQGNPVDILKQKRIDRSIRKRSNYLKLEQVQELLKLTKEDNHPMTLAVILMLHTGLRKNEALTLKWDDIMEIEGIKCITISDTKNHRPHYIPVTSQVEQVLLRAKNNTGHVFPSTQKKDVHMKDERPTLKRLSALVGVEFKCHDLRRTFATRASEVGIDYLMVKRLLNHKSNDITGQYIQWNSKANLLVMKEALEKIKY